MNPTIPYKTFTDYKKAFLLLKEGKSLVAFVDWRFGTTPKDEPMRDLCLVTRKEAFNIDFRVRGMSYGSVSDYKKGTALEFDLFKAQCVALNAGFVEINEI